MLANFARIIGYIACLVLAATGIAKLIDLESFRNSLDSWVLIPWWARSTLSLVIPALELTILVLGIGFNNWRVSCAIGGVLCAAFAATSATHLAMNITPTCNCIGVLTAFFEWAADTKLLLFKSAGLCVLSFIGMAGFSIPNRTISGVAAPSSAPQTRPGFTIVELLVVILILAMLIALSITALSGARKTAIKSGNLQNLRSSTQLVIQYAADTKDCFPISYGPQRSDDVIVSAPGQWSVEISRYFDNSIYWHLPIALAEEPSAALRQYFYPMNNPYPPKTTPGPAFAMSCAMFAGSEFFDLSRRTGEDQYRVTRTAEVTSPSAKAMLIDYSGLVKDGQLLTWSAATIDASFVDGSAETLKGGVFSAGVSSGEGNYRGWVHPMDMYPGGHTANGLRGTDR